jgi:nitric oxide reductase NorD protein
MEEAVGKLWHNWITRAAQTEYPDARVELASIQKKISLWFHAFGGDPGLTIKAATREQWQAKRSLLARIAGLEWHVQLAWKNERDLLLPGAIALFPEKSLNEALYLWLAALTTCDSSIDSDWLTTAQQQVQQVLQRWPGLRKTYDLLVQAHLKQRCRIRVRCPQPISTPAPCRRCLCGCIPFRHNAVQSATTHLQPTSPPTLIR